MTVVLTLVGCSTKTDIPITLNEKFYDTKSVKDGQLSGVIRYLIFFLSLLANYIITLKLVAQQNGRSHTINKNLFIPLSMKNLSS